MTNDDGWTFVSTPNRRRRNPNTTTNQQTPSADHPAWPPIARDLTVDALLADLAIKSHLWRISDCRRQVLQILERLRLNTRPDEQWTVNHAVCLGSGSFSRDNLDTRRRSMLQLAFFLDLVQVLYEASSSSSSAADGEKREIVLLAQDPAYTPLDVAFLRAKNVQVCWSAMATASAAVEGRNHAGDVLEQLKSTSLVCECFMERRPEFLTRLLDAEVELVVGSMLTDAGQIALQRSRISSHGSALNEIERAKLEFVNLEERYNHWYRPYRIPRFDPDPNTFSGLHIAARLTADDDDF